MRLSKIDIVGFKSFAKKTELAFGDGITAIIGPNGSGKSNIADAVRWVLGEQSARALRGGRMEDVIFGGTQQKKALSYCEVTLTFDNSDRLLPVDFTEVAITRRIYRSGDSEYCINQNNCRLKDIQDLFHDTGIGKDGYSIIGQGKVDDILSNKSGDRRTALEEAAGVMRYRVRKEEAARKLDHTEKNLERIEDILSELTARLGPLEEQSRTAREYLKLHDELKDGEINIFLYQSDRMRERLNALSEVIAQMKDEETLEGEKEQALLGECAELEERVKKLDGEIAQKQQDLIAMLSGVEARVGECNVLIERQKNGKAECERLSERKNALTERRELLKNALSDAVSDDGALSAIACLDDEIANKTSSLSALDEKIASDEEALDAMKNGIIEAMNRLSDAKSLIAHFATMHGALESRLNEISGDIERLFEKDTALNQERLEAQSGLDERSGALTDAEDSLKSTQRELTEAENEISEHNKKREATTARLLSMQSRLNALSDMAKSREGYYESVKLVMRDAARDERLSSAIVGVVAELIRVPKEYELAITMTLGSSLQNIITETPEDAKYVIDYLRAHDYGRATMLPLSLLRANRVSESEKRLLNGHGVIGLASDLVSYDAKIESAVGFLLGRTAVVRDLDSGILLKKRTGNIFHIATLAGDIISTGGSMSGGSQKKRAFSLLGREREMQELTEAIKLAEAEKKELLSGSEAASKKLLLLSAQLDAFRAAVSDARVAEMKQREKIEIISRDIADNLSRIDGCKDEQQSIRDNLADLLRQREEADSAQSGIEETNAATRADVTNAQKALAELRAGREQLVNDISDCKVRRMAMRKEQDAAENEKKRIETEHASLEKEIAAIDDETQSIGVQMVAIDDRLAEMQSGVEAEQGAASELKKAQQQSEDERAGVNEQLKSLRTRREEMLVESRSRAERLHKQELSMSRLEMELTSMQDHIWEEYSLTYENALPFKHEISVGALNARINEIKAAIKELGEINVASIEDFKAVSERHNALTVQRDDLRMAKADLESMIVDLIATIEKEFLSKFTLIQKNFTDVFVELFGGGYAELRLSDKADPLNCDIDIIAQPPGKKLQLLSLLSGGERAMTAIALLFAMLRLKPPAFCVLDEIESSLDEENVARFADYLKEYSAETQFIVITHRRGSMAVCDTLYGVSMEEKGVSKIVSAHFEEVS